MQLFLICGIFYTFSKTVCFESKAKSQIACHRNVYDVITSSHYHVICMVLGYDWDSPKHISSAILLVPYTNEHDVVVPFTTHK